MRTLRFFAVLLLAVLSSVSAVQPVKASSNTITIRADGSIDPSTAPISTTDNTTYTLTSDINGSIAIAKTTPLIINGSGHALLGAGSGTGISTSSLDYYSVTIENMRIRFFGMGIGLMGMVLACTIVNCSITNNGAGISINSMHTIFDISANNIANNGGTGIHIGDCEGQISKNNIANNGGPGIFAVDSTCFIQGNNLTNNGGDGIYQMMGGGGIFSENNIIGNKGAGVREGGIDRIFHNNFIGNAYQASTSMTNTWDNGYPSGGNHWSDYNDTDANHDGIGDTPYVIDTNNRDNYPLMQPWTSPDIAVTNVTTSKTIIGQGLILRINATLANFGNRIEGFNLTAYGDLAELQIAYVLLNSGNPTTIQMIWNTIGYAKGIYELAVIASHPEGEVNKLNNIFIFGNIVVTNKGDVNGDGSVNMLDLEKIATVLKTTPSVPNWNSNADVKEDNVINVLDLIFVARHL